MLNRRQIPAWVHESADQQQELTQTECELAYQFVSLQPDLTASNKTELFEIAKQLILTSRRGSTRLPITGTMDATLQCAPHLVGGVGEQKPWVVDRGHLYPQRSYIYEIEIAKSIKERMASPATELEPDRAHLDDIVARPSLLPNGSPIALSDEQLAATLLAVSRRFCVISGGPGTGKTSIIVSLLRVFARRGVETTALRLAAPTGKAASRMTESIREQLQRIESPAEIDLALERNAPSGETIHRLLQYSAQRREFARNAKNQLSADVVIIDEASMIDLSLMAKLLRAIPLTTTIILVGDAHQLPSVEAGAVLRDLVPENRLNSDHAAFLTKSYRMRADDPSGNEILTRARAIQQGQFETFREGVAATFAFENGGVSVHPSLDTREMIETFADVWFERRFTAPHIRKLANRVYPLERGEFADDDTERIRELLDFHNNARVLCPTRVRRTGSAAINEMFHRRMIETTTLEGEPRFVSGEPILMLKNDYHRSLFNGDHGVVLLATTEETPTPHPMAVFPSDTGLRAHHLGALGNRITLAYAMTVHKSQGSEFNDVVIVLPDHDLPVLTQELLYTAVTRAKRSVTLVGNWEIIERAIARRVSRHSGLRERIEGSF